MKLAPAAAQWTNNNQEACTSCRGEILSKKHWWLMFFIFKLVLTKSGWPRGVPNTFNPCQCVGNSDPLHTTAVGSYVSAVRCDTPHPDGFTPAAFQTLVFLGLMRMPVVLNIASCSAAQTVVVLSGHGITTCVTSKKANNVSSSRNTSECSFCNAPWWPREYNKALMHPLSRRPHLGRWCEPCQNHPPRSSATVLHGTC